PPIPASRDCGASVPAQLRVGRRDGGVERGLEEWAVVHRSRPARAGTDRQDDRHLELRLNCTEDSTQQRQPKESRAMTNDMHLSNSIISQEALALLGDGKIAYVKPISSEEVASLFPQAPKIAPGTQLYALHAADGRPMMLTDSREAAIANAWSHELEMVSVH